MTDTARERAERALKPYPGKHTGHLAGWRIALALLDVADAIREHTAAQQDGLAQIRAEEAAARDRDRGR